MLAQGLVAQGGGPRAIPKQGGGSAACRFLEICRFSQSKREPSAQHGRMTTRVPLAPCFCTPLAKLPKAKQGLSDGDAMDVNPAQPRVTPREKHAAARVENGNTGVPGGSDGEGRAGNGNEDDASLVDEIDGGPQGGEDNAQQEDPTIAAWLAGRNANPTTKPTFAKAAGASKPLAKRTKRGKNTTTMWLNFRSRTRTGQATGSPRS